MQTFTHTLEYTYFCNTVIRHHHYHHHWEYDRSVIKITIFHLTRWNVHIEGKKFVCIFTTPLYHTNLSIYIHENKNNQECKKNCILLRCYYSQTYRCILLLYSIASMILSDKRWWRRIDSLISTMIRWI